MDGELQAIHQLSVLAATSPLFRATTEITRSQQVS